jgi:hypothetical protein
MTHLALDVGIQHLVEDVVELVDLAIDVNLESFVDVGKL